MPVKLLAMHKDEEDILEEFILYHSYLFGIENIIILDNFSSSPSIDILKKHEENGLVVCYNEWYHQRKVRLLELAKQYPDEICFFWDTDQFILSHAHGSLSCEKEDIDRVLRSLPDSTRYRFSFIADVVCPLTESVDDPIVNLTEFKRHKSLQFKSFHHGKDLMALDLGLHNNTTTHNEDNTSVALGFLHFQRRSLSSTLKKCINCLNGNYFEKEKLLSLSDINRLRDGVSFEKGRQIMSFLENVKQKKTASHRKAAFLLDYIHDVPAEVPGCDVQTTALSEKIRQLRETSQKNFFYSLLKKKP